MTRLLRLGPKIDLPMQAVTETFGILAARGAGKSNTAAVMAEEMFAAGLPFVVIDPVRAWWGLRASRDGTGPGIPIPIFGGPHGDVPLERGGGAFMAQLIVTERLSCVLDLSSFESEGAKKTFLLDFARELYQRNEAPLHLFLEEADGYIPQKPMRDEAQLLRAWENIVRRGRGRGLGITLITQRSASINKNVLTQVQTLIAMRTTGPQDIAAIKEWVKYHQQSEAILSSLAKLGDGEAWVWSPHFLQRTEKVHFRLRATFDSGATPKVGESTKAPATLADIDLAVVKKRMAATIEKAKAEDPRELRRRIAELEAALRKPPQPVAKLATPTRVEVPIFKDGHVKRLEAAVSKAEILNERSIKVLTEVLGSTHDLLREVRAAASGLRPQAGPGLVRGESPVSYGGTAGPRPSPWVPEAKALTRRAAPRQPGGLPQMERRFLTALAQHPAGLTKGQLLIHAGYASSGPTSTCFARLSGDGWMATTADGRLVVTTSGLAALGDFEPLPTGRELQEYVLGKMSRMESTMLRVLFDAYPEPLMKGTILEKAGYASSGPTSTAFAKLTRLNYVVEVRGAGLRASEEFFL